MKNLICIGEALIDFIPSKINCDFKDVPSFERKCGGAPANVAAACSRLGVPSKMITQLGNDGFGDFILESIKNAGVNTDCILRTDKAHTSLAFVTLGKNGERDFLFYRNPGADMLLDASNIKKEWFSDCGCLHFCSVSLIDAPIKDAHIKAIQYAKENGAFISFDPNIRLPLWDDAQKCKKAVTEFIKYADILKISDEELEFITEETDIEIAAEKLFAQGVKILMYTLGKDGAMILTPKYTVSAKGKKVTPVDTTGAGDAICGAFINCILKDNITSLENIDKQKMKEYLEFSNLCSAFSVCNHGAIASYGDLSQIDEFSKIAD